MKNLFNELYKQSSSIFGELVYWNKIFNISDFNTHPYIEFLLVEIQKIYQTESIELYLIFENAFLQDILRLKQSNPNELEILNYLQLSLFTNSSGYFNIKGLFTYTYDSIVYSLQDVRISNGEVLTIEDERFWNFLLSRNPHIAVNAHSLIIDWLTQLYYCSYSSSSFFSFGYDLWDVALGFAMDSKHFTIEKLRLLSSLISWSSTYKKGEDFYISRFLMNEYEKLSWDDDLKIEICTQLILLKDIPVSVRKTYYEELNREVELEGHSELHLLVSITESLDDFNENYDLILKAASKYNTFLKSIIKNDVSFAFERARIFKILNSLIILLAEEGKSIELINVLGAYYDVKSELNDSVLFILPYYEKGILFFNNATSILKNQDTFKLTRELINLSNKLFNRAIGLIGDNTDLLVPKRIMGVPTNDFSEAFERKAYELYNFNIVKEHFNKNIDGMLQLGFNSIPVQALMLKQVNFTFPIINSFSISSAEKALRKILIWTSGSYTSYFEQTSIIWLCKKYNVDYEILDESLINKKVFIEKYLSDTYSTLWIASHGEHNNYEPQKSIINISSDDTISLEELLMNKPTFESNRLLVLNLCESGINSEGGGFKGIGFGHQLVSPNQSIISHLWMIEPKVAMIFGICLAIGLIAHKKNYFDAYCYAVNTLIMGKDQILEEIKKELIDLEEVIERIENADSIDWNNILNWGSAVMYK